MDWYPVEGNLASFAGLTGAELCHRLRILIWWRALPAAKQRDRKMIQQLVDAKGLCALVGNCAFLARKYVVPERRSGIRKLNCSFSPANLCINLSPLLGARQPSRRHHSDPLPFMVPQH